MQPAPSSRLGAGCIGWEDTVSKPAALRFERLSFGHPPWIVYSSGTTGLPKAIVHSPGASCRPI